MAGETVTVTPKEGRTIYLPGGTHGFVGVPVSLPAEHAEAFRAAGHVTVEGEKPAKAPKAAEEPAPAA